MNPGSSSRPRLYLDCDGVLADFDRGAAQVLRMSPAEYERRHGLGRFWAALAAAPDFFGALPLMPDAMALYDAVRHREPAILTGLPRGAWAEPQKRAWAARHFPGVPVITTSAARKREHCRPGDVLVDDRDTYRHLWERAACSCCTGAPRSRCGSWGRWGCCRGATPSCTTVSLPLEGEGGLRVSGGRERGCGPGGPLAKR